MAIDVDADEPRADRIGDARREVALVAVGRRGGNRWTAASGACAPSALRRRIAPADESTPPDSAAHTFGWLRAKRE